MLYVDVFVSIYSVQLGAFPSLKTELAGGLFNFYLFFLFACWEVERDKWRIR
jgi:hypothetical protein